MTILQLLKKLRSNSYVKEVIKEHLIWKLNQLSHVDLSLPEPDFYNISEYIQDAGLLMLDLTNLLDCLKKAPSVVSLDLRGNNLGNEGAQILADFLSQDSSFESLFIERNNIQDKGAIALAKGLEKNSTLLSLDPAQAQWMQTPTHFKDRYYKDMMRDKHITHEFVKLASNKPLHHSWAEGNPISQIHINIIDKILVHKRWNYAKKKLARESAICKLSQDLMNQEIKQGTQIGALVGLTIGGVGALLGIVGWPSVLPIFFTVGALHRTNAAFKSKTLLYNEATQKIDAALKEEETAQMKRPPVPALAPTLTTGESIAPVVLSYENEDGIIEITLQQKKPVPHF